VVHQITHLLDGVHLCGKALARPGIVAEDGGGGMSVAAGDSATGCQQPRTSERARSNSVPRPQDPVGGIAHRLDRGDPVLKERVEATRKVVVLEGLHRLCIGHCMDVVDVQVGIDQTRQHPAVGGVDLRSASQRRLRHGGNSSTVDRDVAQSGKRLVAVEH
jgi:hypothetical protein